MKDYLKESLAEEEILILYGMIWRIGRKFRNNYFINKNKTISFLEAIDYMIEDTYCFYKFTPSFYSPNLKPFTEEEKCDIVMSFDNIIRESGFLLPIRTLTFNEKLVFFLFDIYKYNQKEIAILIGYSERTIGKIQKSLDEKKRNMREVSYYENIF